MTLFSATIVASADDAQEAAGTVTIDGGALNANNATGYIGLRFQNVTIPAGATINTATMDVYLVSGSFDDPDVTIYGHDTDDAGAFTTSSNDISGRTATTATASWDASGLGTGVKTTPDFASVIQEIVDRGGWASGQDIVIILKGDDAGTLLRIRAYDSGSGDYATIDIDYTAAAAQNLTGATISAGTTLYAGALTIGLVGAYIASGTTLYGGELYYDQTLSGAYISAGTVLYEGALTYDQDLDGAYIDSSATLYPPANLAQNQELDGAYIDSSATLYAPPTISLIQNLEGAYISEATVYAPIAIAPSYGIIPITNFTHHEIEDVSSTSFSHETPPGDNRLLLVIATYKDTAGVASLVFGSTGSGNGQFATPYGLAVATDGTIYVVDSDNNRVQYFDDTGAYVGQWGSSGTGNGQFDTPTSIAIDSAGNVYVTDRSNHRVQKFTDAGVYVSQWGSSGSGNGQFNNPSGIAIGPDDVVYVSDMLNYRVQIFDTDGVYVGQWGSSGTGNGQFGVVYGLTAALDGLVYVVDSTNHRVQVFDADGTYLSQWGTPGDGNGEFDDPRYIVVTPDGYAYITDTDNNRIQKFTVDGEFAIKWGTFGTGNGQFNDPFGIAIDSTGDLYVADSGTNRVQKFNAGLKLNAAHYGLVPMDVGPLVDSGDYYMAFYTMENPPVGTAEVSIAAPTGPDLFMVTAISLNNVEVDDADYTGPDAGRIEQETSTTALQISHNRTYPNYTLSIWAVLYETASETLTAAASNVLWTTRNVDNLKTGLGFRYTAAATTSSLTFGATASGAVTQKITGVIHLEAAIGNLSGAYIDSGTTLYGGYIETDGFQPLEGAYISSGTTLYGGTTGHRLDGAYITSGTTLYEGTIENDDADGVPQYIELPFLGRGTPNVINGAYISADTELYEPAVFTSLAGAYIEAATVLYEGTAAHVTMDYGGVYPPVSIVNV